MKRLISYIIIIIAGFLMQVSVFPMLPYAFSSPNLLLIIVVSYGFMMGKQAGMLAGLFSGLLLDLFYGDTIGFYALIYMYIGYVNAICNQYYYEEYVNLPLILCGIDTIVLGIYIYVFQFLFRSRMDFGYYFIKIILPEMIYTLVVTLVGYQIFLLINRRMEEKEKESDTFV